MTNNKIIIKSEYEDNHHHHNKLTPNQPIKNEGEINILTVLNAKKSQKRKIKVEPNAEFACKNCKQLLQTSAKLKKHESKCTYKGVKFRCHNCKKIFKTQKNFDSHQCVKCDICCKYFKSMFNLNTHNNKVHEKKSFECDYCGEKLSFKNTMHRHLMTFHYKAIEEFHCDFCLKVFANKNALKQHMRIHRMKVSCEICKGHFFPYNFYTHKKLAHSNERNHKCSHCPAAFKTKSKLERHMNIHDSRISCCGMRFQDKTELNNHIKSHTDPSILECKICNKKLKTLGNLELHMKLLHTGGIKKHLKCNFCNYSTHNTGHFKFHKATHENIEEKIKKHPNWLRCDKCSIVICSKRAILRHFKLRHGWAEGKEKI